MAGLSVVGGDEIALKRAAVHTDFGDPREVLLRYLPRLAPGAGPIGRLRAATNAVVHGHELVEGYSRANCEVAARTAQRVGLGHGVVAGLTDVYEHWDGNGGARHLRGNAIALAARMAQVAVVASLFHGLGGIDAAVEALRRRADASLDPDLVNLVRDQPNRILDVLGVSDPVSEVVVAEPGSAVHIASADLDLVCRAFGEVVDLKTPLHHGHAAGVAVLAAAAGQRFGLADDEVAQLRRAALVHDLGPSAVPTGVCERRGALSWTDQERIRLHAYHAERVLARCGPLAALAPIAGMHHVRLDGSGYHRQASAPALPFAARVLAAEATAGRLDTDAARVMIEAAGGRADCISRARAVGLTERQVEVLRLVARGLSNQQIADRLVINRAACTLISAPKPAGARCAPRSLYRPTAPD